ncbi:MAG: putative lipid II flippase FtsW [Gammaproteobacteria bacterium]|nr:putative lipid II flippase FtsW [Gammaproteobacteria bacterium]MDH5594656.1 putative lipid II flippase FtsW [Gammaproteobacteria bacterium]
MRKYNKKTTMTVDEPARIDFYLLGATLILLALGLVMVTSASISVADQKTGQPFYYLFRQSVYVGMGLLCGFVVSTMPVSFWEKHNPKLLLAGIVLLVLVLIPGIGREVNGSIRWIGFGLFNLQPSELVKLFVVIYLPGYLMRHTNEVQTSVSGLIKPMSLLLLICALLLLEPDFGAASVILMTGLGVMFMGGVRLLQFSLFMSGMLVVLAGLALSSPYRVERLTSFMNPWADPFNSGFQLTQALIAFGRGDFSGVGLGDSVQKLFYLPEAHTDFLFAIMAEELGFISTLFVIALFVIIVWRSFKIGQLAEQQEKLFSAFLAYGIGLWLGIQAFVNIGVNMGLLPTKGLTLPLMSYGGSSIVVTCAAIGILLRIYFELRTSGASRRKQVQEESRWGWAT